MLLFQISSQSGVVYKDVIYKESMERFLESFNKHEEITLPHELIFVFIRYFVGTILLNNVAKTGRFGKKILMGVVPNRGSVYRR